MHTASDIQLVRHIRAQVTRRYIDASCMEVNVMHGVVYLRGYISHLRTHKEIELQTEVDTIVRILKQQSGVREVIWEATVRE